MASSKGNVRRWEERDLWVGRFQLDGKRKAVYGKTKAEASRKLREAQRLAEAGVATAGADLTTGRYLDEWLTTSVRGKLRPATVKSYEDTVRRFLRPALGRVPLVKLEPRHIERMLAELPPHLSPTTRRYCYVVLRIALGRAYKQGLVMRNVATMVDAHARRSRRCDPSMRTRSTASSRASRVIGMRPCTSPRSRPACGRASCSGCAGRTWTSTTGP